METLEAETFDGAFPFAPHYLDVTHCRMHYIDEGAGEPVVFVHGDPTWSYLYRKFIGPLSSQHRCIAPDLMGMGKSSVPHEPYPYRLHHHIDNLESLLLQLDLTNLTLVVHDWGGPVGLGFATRHPDRIQRLVLMNTWAFAAWPGGEFPKLLQMIRSERGEKFVLEKNGYVRNALLGTTYHQENLTEAVLNAYLAPFPTPASRLALLCWTRDIPVNEGDPSFATMQTIEQRLALLADKPALLIWGMQDPVLPESVLRRWQAIYPQAAVHEIADASHFLQEDAPVQIIDRLKMFLAANP